MTTQPQMLAGRYTLLEPISSGGMGDVYRGEDTLTGQIVAIKHLRTAVIAGDPTIVERFNREAEALRQLNHPNIVKVYEAITQDDNHYIVMEYVSGGTLAYYRQQAGQLTINQVLEIGLGIADALTRAHHLRIVHRDIKPANVLMAADGTPRLTDFGVALLETQERMTETGIAMGTLDYLSPEAINGEPVDIRADIWAFGVLLFEMLTGERPFKGNSATTLMLAIIQQPLPDLLTLRPETPSALVNLIDRMLDKERATRLTSARQVGAELEAILRGEDIPSRGYFAGQPPTPPSGEPATVKLPERQPEVNAAPLAAPPPVRAADLRLFWLVGGLVIALAAVVVLFSGVAIDLFQTEPTATPAPTPLPTADQTDWVSHSRRGLTLRLPPTYVELTTSPLFNSLVDQFVNLMLDFAGTSRLNEFIRRLMTADNILFLANDPASQGFVACLLEPPGFTNTLEMQQDRLTQIVEGSGLELGDFTIIQAETPGEQPQLRFTAAAPALKVRATGLLLLVHDQVVWCTVTGNEALFAASAPETEAIIQSIEVDEAGLIRSQATATATPTATVTPSPTLDAVAGQDDLVRFSNRGVSLSLPSTYSDLTRSPLFATVLDQYLQIVNTSGSGTRFMDLAERLIQPETILVVASDPVALNFAACLVEITGLTGSPVIQQERMAQIFADGEFGFEFTGLTDATADQSGTLRFTVTSSRLRLVAYGYGVIFADRIVWCSVAGNDAFQAEISADADILFQSLTIDLDELVRTQPTPQAATATP